MKNARIWNDLTKQWIEFDYDKVLEADERPLTKEELKDIEDFIRRTNEKN